LYPSRIELANEAVSSKTSAKQASIKATVIIGRNIVDYPN
jgi:hypothetical protein